MQAVSFGHLTIPLETVPRLSWELAVGDYVLEDNQGVAEQWTYYDDVNVSCSFELDLDAARSKLLLPRDSALGALIVARSSGTPIVLASNVLPVVGRKQQLYFSVPADQISGTLFLEFQIVLARAVESEAHPLSPSRVGHTVFRAHRRLVLEGSAPRLPMLPVNFSDHGIPDGGKSLWWLRLMTRDLYASASSAVWLWMNAENKSIKSMLEDPDAPESTIWLNFLEIDFLRQLLREALSHEELSLTVEYPEESLGSVLVGVVRLLGESVDSVRNRYKDDPGRVEAELQSKVGE